MLWDELIAQLKALPSYFNHVVRRVCEDGTTIEVDVWLTNGDDVNQRLYVVKTKLTEAGREVLGYKRVV